MAVRIQLRRDIAVRWNTVNPVLAEGEIGLELDTNQFKVGNGLDPWVDLPYGGVQGPPGRVVVSTNVTCDPAVTIGDWVALNSSGVAQKASASSLETSNVFGLVESKLNTNTANVLVMGISANLFSSLDMTKEYYLSEVPGEMTATPPSTPGSVLLKLGQPVSSSQLVILKGIRVVRS